MDVLLLGGSGFVGTHLARRLVRDGHRVRIGTRHATGARSLRVLPGVTVRRLDPDDAERVAAELDGCDALVHLVGSGRQSGRRSGRQSGSGAAYVASVDAAVEACRRAGLSRMLQVSAVQAGNEASEFLRSRGEGERRVRDSGLDWSILRAATIFGPDDRFLNAYARLLAFTPVLPLGRPDAVLAPVYVGDVVEALVRVLERGDTVGETFELCGPDRWTLREIVAWVAEQRGYRRWIVGLPDGLARLQARFLDWVPGTLSSSDRFRSLGVPAVCGGESFAGLDIDPWPMRERASEWLRRLGRQSRYRRFRETAGRIRGSGPT